MQNTGAKTQGEAVVIALSELNRRRRLQQLVERFGTLDGFMTQEDLRAMRDCRAGGTHPPAQALARSSLRSRDVNNR
jgi:hypothetical protein